MKTYRKIAVFLFCLSLYCVSAVCSASPAAAGPAQDFPSKPILILNPYSAGAGGDLEVRALQPTLEKLLGQPLVTDYLTTGSGVAATEKIFAAEPDGYSLLYLNNPASSINELTGDVYYKVLEFEFIQNVSTEYRCIATLSSSGIKTAQDMIDKSKTQTLSIAHSGIGSSGHLQTLLIEKALGIDLNDVPFAGIAAAKAAVLGAHVDLWAVDIVSTLPLVKSGELVIVAVNAPERHKNLPDVPTFKELGFEGVEVSTSRGFVAPKGLPADVKQKLIQIFNQAVNSDEMKKYAEKAGTNLNPVSGEDYRKFTENTYRTIEAVANLFEQ
jgi:tripartite-type tricarboxylate transporter receptor subunit TctC